MVFTPHLGEFRAQFGDQLADATANDRWAAVSKAAHTVKATVLLKGVPTVVADLRGPIHVVASGNPGLATGGSGDLLAGFIGAFLARPGDRKSTRLNSSHSQISYAVFCLKKKIDTDERREPEIRRLVDRLR